MWGNSKDKLMDQIFNLKFTSKQMVRSSKKCESEYNAELNKVKVAIQKSAPEVEGVGCGKGEREDAGGGDGARGGVDIDRRSRRAFLSGSSFSSLLLLFFAFCR